MANKKKNIVIGMFHNRLNPNKVSRAYLYSAIAKNKGVDFFYFTSKDVDLSKKVINGKYYENGKWKEKIFEYPDVIINSANQITEKQNSVSQELQNLIPFTSYPVGSKELVYKKIMNSNLLKDYLIPYKEILTVDIFFDFLKNHKKVVVKPVRGHHGEDVASIEEKEDYYIFRLRNKQMKLSKEELESFINSLTKRMIVQKFIDCHLKTGEPYDFRIHIQKDSKGNWGNPIIIPRIGSFSRVITNLSQGSQMVDFNSFIYYEFDKERKEIKQLLLDFTKSFVENFESLYPYKFDELGLDIGLDENKKIWLYEVNWRPGHIFIEVKTGIRTINYAIYLAKQKMKGGKK